MCNLHEDFRSKSWYTENAQTPFNCTKGANAASFLLPGHGLIKLQKLSLFLSACSSRRLAQALGAGATGVAPAAGIFPAPGWTVTVDK